MFGLKLLIQSVFVLLNYAYGGNGNVMPMVGGQKDSNNCLTGAGFTWCDSSQECIRRWETPCADNYSDCSDCLKRQRQGENIACPVQCDTVSPTCETDEDCGNTHFCRPTTMNVDGPKECVLYSKEGDSCGGYTLPSYQSRCQPPLECANSKSGIRPSVPMVADAPGTCMRPCNPPDTRDAYGNCRSIREPPIMVPELGPGPVLTGTFNGPDCGGCPPPVPCPAPGPDCNYIPPLSDECGCTVGCGEINCYAVDPLPMPPPPVPHVCSEVMCMMYCENGNQIDENGCDICACNIVSSLTNTEEICPIQYEECENEFVCPKVTEITKCGEGGIKDYTTYQLSLVIINPTIKNIYAIFGDSLDNDDQMVFPAAYQFPGPFHSNIGGISTDIQLLSPNSKYDSWLTIGLTDGDPDNQLGTIGIDFESWNLNSPLVVNNGAVFTMYPDYDLNGLTEVIIGQLTIPTSISTEAAINVQGKLKYSQETWKQSYVLFSINPPIRNDNGGGIPNNCEVWYDGCNTCQVRNGVIGACTRMMCFREDNPRCMNFNNGH